MSTTEAQVAVLSAWKDGHDEEHRDLWKKVNNTHDRALQTETRLMIYTTLGAAVGSVVGSVIGALIFFVATKGRP